MDTATALDIAERHLKEFAATGHVFDVLTIGKPKSHQTAIEFAKIVSKLSPILGNMIEFSFADVLNQVSDLQEFGRWRRQDPDFPDTVFEGSISPRPGFEIKAWFPLATEITARFKDSQLAFENENTRVALLAWLPEFVVYGQPKVVDVCVVSGKSVAEARDRHYHRPPDYVVLEPGDTAARTRNLQQTNTSGLKFQESKERLREAEAIVASWPSPSYSASPEYQRLLRQLIAQFDYRVDTNYAKIDRVEHDGIEAFKRSVLGRTYCGQTIKQWSRILGRANEAVISEALSAHLHI